MQPLDEDWNLLLGLLPTEWCQRAVLSGACERLRGFSSASSLLRTLLLHVGCGYSCRRRRKMGPLWQGERDQRCGYAMATAGATAPDVRWRPLF
jgi:hypothetical protein